MATLVNYAVHPEVLGSDQGVLSPDLVGPLRDRIQEKGGGIAIFMNSAQGGMVTADNRAPEGKEFRNWEECVRIGQLLADESLRIVQGAPVQSAPGLFCAAKTISFPVDSPQLRAITKASPLGLSGPDDGTVSTQLNVVNLGNAQILSIPGEALAIPRRARLIACSRRWTTSREGSRPRPERAGSRGCYIARVCPPSPPLTGSGSCSV